MDLIPFSCVVNTNIPNKPLKLTILLDDNIIYNNFVTGEETITHNFNVDDSDHTLLFQISEKTDSHIIRDNANIIIDSTEISITDISLDGSNITKFIMVNPLEYIHDFNGTSDTLVDKFYNIAGCNGTIKLNFSTPIPIWLLENM